MNKIKPSLTSESPSNKNTSGYSLKSKILIGLLLFCLMIAGVYFYYVKDKIISVSSEKLSELLNAHLDFEQYQFTSPGTLEISGLQIQSPYPKSQYTEVNKFQREWFSIKIRKITLYDFDYIQFINDRTLKASHIELDSVEVDLYRDKRLPLSPDKIPLMASLLQKLKFKVYINNFQLTNTNIRYYEQTKHADNQGMISFKESKVTCNNITNIPEFLSKNQIMTCDIQSTVLAAAKVSGQVLFDLNSKTDKFTVVGSSQSFQAKELNRIISGVMPASITDGQIRSLKFSIAGNDNEATGHVDMEYEGMKINVIDRNDNKFKSAMSSFVVNTIIRNQNLSSGKNYKQGQIKFKREQNRSMFNYWWKSLRSGIIDIMMTDTGKLFNLDEKAQDD